MKQYQINKAYQALRRLSGVQIPLGKAYEIYNLMKIIETPYTFEEEREKNLIEKYGGTIEPDGTVVFKKKEDAGNFQLEISEMGDMDVQIEFKPVEINESEMKNCTISPNDIFALEGFIEFKL